MIRAHYKVLQDFLNMLLMGVVTGVVFSFALTGAVFLLTGSARAAEELHRVTGMEIVDKRPAAVGRVCAEGVAQFLPLQGRG